MKKLKLIGTSSNIKTNNITKSRYDTTSNFYLKSRKKMNTSKSHQTQKYSTNALNKKNPLNYSSTNDIEPQVLSKIDEIIKEIIEKSAEIIVKTQFRTKNFLKYLRSKKTKSLSK